MNYQSPVSRHTTLDHDLVAYADKILPQQTLRIFNIGGEPQSFATAVAAILPDRSENGRTILTLKRFSHGNTKKPDPESFELLVCDARDHELGKLAEPFHQAVSSLVRRGRAAWILPGEFLDSPEAGFVRQSLTGNLTVTHVHRFGPDAGPYAGAVLVWVGNAPAVPAQQVVLSQGGSPLSPQFLIDLPISILAEADEWSGLIPGELPSAEAPAPARGGDILGDYFDVMPGLETGDDSFFILSEDEITARRLESAAFRPVLPHPSSLDAEVIEARPGGLPDLDDRFYILDTDVTEDDLSWTYPEVAKYIAEGKARGIPSQPACRHRTPWYSQEKRPVPVILCAAQDGQPCWFILNHSNAVASDAYQALYPKPEVEAALKGNPALLDRIWKLLNKAIEANDGPDATVENLTEITVPGLQNLLSH